MKLSLAGKIKLKKALRYSALLLLFGFCAIAIATNFFGKQAQTQAAAVSISTSNRYFLDGWEMSSQNTLGRMMPVASGNLNGADVTISGGFEQRMDNSISGFNNSPLFTRLVGGNPLNYAFVNTDGSTSPNSLVVTGNSAVTTTPLDFFRNTSGWFNESSVSYGVVFTGYFYNATNINNLRFSAVAHDGCMIEAYNNGVWQSVYNDYSNHAFRSMGSITSSHFNYIGGTFVPIRIRYYNSSGATGMYIFASDDGAAWHRITGSSSFAQFYALPEANNEYAGMVADYYVADTSGDLNQYNGADTVNSFVSDYGGSHTFTNSLVANYWASGNFAIRNFRFSYLSSDVSINITPSTCNYATDQAIDDDVVGTTEGGPTVDNRCVNLSTPFLDTNARPRKEQTELWNVPSNPLMNIAKPSDWIGGRSRLDLKVSGALTINSGSAIDVSGAGWSGALAMYTSSYPDNNVMYRGFGYGGGNAGKLHSDNTHSIAAGGSHGAGSVQYPNNGKGASNEVNPVTADYPHAHAPIYDNVMNIQFPGSGGGWSGTEARPGNGGGLIQLDTNTISLAGKIRADGADSVQEGGAGSGGGLSIVVDTNPGVILGNYQISANGGTNTSWGNVCFGLGGGGSVYLKGKFQASLASALPGSTTDSTCLGSGAQYAATEGVVIVDLGTKPALSIEKTLVPLERNGEPNTSFNPYALQLGDKITVTLHVKDLTTGTVVKDDVLKQVTGAASYYYCNPEVLAGGSPPELPIKSKNGNATGHFHDGVVPYVDWTANISGEDFFSYNCTVDKK